MGFGGDFALQTVPTYESFAAGIQAGVMRKPVGVIVVMPSRRFKEAPSLSDSPPRVIFCCGVMGMPERNWPRAGNLETTTGQWTQPFAVNGAITANGSYEPILWKNNVLRSQKVVR